MKAEALDRIADAIRGRGLAQPAVLLLEMHRPMARILHEAANMSAPLLSMLVGAGACALVRELSAEPDAVERLIRLLEQ